MSLSQALFTSTAQTWNTPACVLDRLRELGPIVLDPCSNEHSIVGAREEWRIERGEDGLARPWPDLGLVFVNPPYDDLERWAAKMAREAARHVEIVALIPARVETKAFQQHILPTCTALAFWKGRLSFGAGRAHTAQESLFGATTAPIEQGENAAPFPSALPYWGNRPRRFARAFERDPKTAWVVVPR